MDVLETDTSIDVESKLLPIFVKITTHDTHSQRLKPCAIVVEFRNCRPVSYGYARSDSSSLVSRENLCFPKVRGNNSEPSPGTIPKTLLHESIHYIAEVH